MKSLEELGRFLKRLFCTHKDKVHTASFRDSGTGIYMPHRWVCNECGTWHQDED